MQHTRIRGMTSTAPMTTPRPTKAELAALAAACAPADPPRPFSRVIRGVGKWADYSIGTNGQIAFLLHDPENAAGAVEEHGFARVIETEILSATEHRTTLPAWDGAEHWRALPASWTVAVELGPSAPVLGVAKHHPKRPSVYPLGVPRVPIESPWRSPLRFGVEVRYLLDAIDWTTAHHAGAGVAVYSGHHSADALIFVRAPLDVRRPLTPIRHIALVMPWRV